MADSQSPIPEGTASWHRVYILGIERNSTQTIQVDANWLGNWYQSLTNVMEFATQNAFLHIITWLCTDKKPYKSTGNHEQSETFWYLLTQSKLCHISNKNFTGIETVSTFQLQAAQFNGVRSPTPISQRHVYTDASRNDCDIQSIREGEPEVWLSRWQIHSFPSLRELLLGIGVGHRRWNNYSFTLLPVGWCSNAVSSCQLKRIQNTNNLVEVTTSCAWVKEAQFQLPKKQTKSQVSFKLPIIAYL